jgi:hypothetical protein
VANAPYTSFLNLLWKGDIDLENDTIKVALIDTADYSFDSAHDFWNDAVAGAVGTPTALTSKTFTAGVFDAADVTIPTVSGDPCEALILFKDTGDPATSPLIAYLDTGVTGLPVSPNGGNITIQWNVSGVLALV